ncbi:MAG: nicotinamide-nucleotide adenylyltransferase [Promethearchaeota archaeon]|nr:MAG: nicotinamide-nucleotide adenylyltransferase [Candidatus Lokiarchaeota archaeon]
MEKEILACIDEENKIFLQSGQISKFIFPMERNEAHDKKISHLITRFFIISITPEGKLLYLVQKRGKNKKSFPGYFTDSSSGHVNWERNLNLNKIKKDALRELEEEFGIPPNAVQRILFYDIYTEGLETAYIFFGIVDQNIKINPNRDELDVKFSKFYTTEELEDLLENEKYIDYSKETWRKILNTDILSLFKKQKESLHSKKHNISLFIGRFQPLHHGHIHVIKNILKSYTKLKIGIGSSQISHSLNDPFTKEERKAFINAALKKRNISPNRYEIFFIPDIFDAKKWVNHVISIVGDFDSVFSNSDWVRALFFNRGIKIEKKITIFQKKFNGNNIRNLIIKNDKKWKTLVPKEVVKLIQKFKGTNRIKSLYTKTVKL